MKGHMKRIGERGSTLIENVMATALFGAMAVSVYPIFTDAKKFSKQGDIRQLCQDAVRSKLEEYRQGRSTSPMWAANPAGFVPQAPEYQNDYVGGAKPQLIDLTVSSRTSTSVNGGVTLAMNGFTYAKVRYNRYFPQICNGVSTATRLTQAVAAVPPTLQASDLQLGLRECVGRNWAWRDGDVHAGSTSSLDGWCVDPQDQRIAAEIPGFKLYVKLELSTPWPIAPGANAGKNAQFSNTCPNSGGWTPAGFAAGANVDLYDFNGVGDGIRVTVTGVMDTPAVSPTLASFAGLPANDPRAFMCSAQGTVYPESYPVRYYLSTDGRIYPVQGGGNNGGNLPILRGIYSQTAGMLASGITSFAVHPRNLSVYVLRPGSLMRYSNCGGSILDCETTPTLNGVSDNGTPGWLSVQEFPLNPAIRYIAVNFATGAIYGMTGDRGSILQIAISCLNGTLGAPDWSAGLANCDKAGGTVPTVTYATVPPNAFPRPMSGAMPGRLSGFFIAPGGNDAYVSDYSASSSTSATSYSSSIYPINDTNLRWPIARLPVAAITFSK